MGSNTYKIEIDKVNNNITLLKCVNNNIIEDNNYSVIIAKKNISVRNKIVFTNMETIINHYMINVTNIWNI